MGGITVEELQEILRKHKLWLKGEKDGEKATLSYATLSYATLSYADLRYADLSYADLSYADLRYADLSYADLSDADLRDADLRGAKLSYVNLSDADLRGAKLSYVNLRGSTGLVSQIEYIETNFETTNEGYVAYKSFGGEYEVLNGMDIKENTIISEVCSPNRTDSCGCGITVAPMEWVKKNYVNENLPIWKVIIKWKWLPGVVVPYNTDGKIRCEKVMLLEIVKEAK